jgi:hypothetical protein
LAPSAAAGIAEAIPGFVVACHGTQFAGADKPPIGIALPKPAATPPRLLAAPAAACPALAAAAPAADAAPSAALAAEAAGLAKLAIAVRPLLTCPKDCVD